MVNFLLLLYIVFYRFVSNAAFLIVFDFKTIPFKVSQLMIHLLHTLRKAKLSSKYYNDSPDLMPDIPMRLLTKTYFLDSSGTETKTLLLRSIAFLFSSKIHAYYRYIIVDPKL